MKRICTAAAMCLWLCSPVFALPTKFEPLDTKRLLGSPDPLPPLEVVRAFPKLTFGRPVALANAGDGSNRIFVCDQIGKIYRLPRRIEMTSTEGRRPSSISRIEFNYKHFEEGLLGLAFHPTLRPENGEFFVYYSAEASDSSILARFRVSSDDPNQRRPKRFGGAPPGAFHKPFGNHNGGSDRIRPRRLPLHRPRRRRQARRSRSSHAQNLGTLLGSLLRIDVDVRARSDREYGIPKDNPFAQTDGPARDNEIRREIYAYGIRNPWRISTSTSLTGTRLVR